MLGLLDCMHMSRILDVAVQLHRPSKVEVGRSPCVQRQRLVINVSIVFHVIFWQKHVDLRKAHLIAENLLELPRLPSNFSAVNSSLILTHVSPISLKVISRSLHDLRKTTRIPWKSCEFQYLDVYFLVRS